MEVRDRRLDPDTKLASIRALNSTYPAAVGRFPSTVETHRANVRGFGTSVARECPPVGDPYNDQVRSDDLFEVMIVVRQR